MWKTEEKVREYVEKYQMITSSDKVVVGVSGGADSVCLLLILLKLRESLNFSIIVVHINHNLRGEEAKADENFVKSLCERLDVSFQVVSKDVNRISQEKSISLEEAGRNARYDAFSQVCKKEGGTKIALAHHQDDQAETMIHHLARGTGLRGLCALKPVSGNRIRPLLCLTRQEVETYLKEAGQEWQTDKTNLEDDYTRNKIRHHVIEYLTRQINPKAVAHMAGTAEELVEIEELLEQWTKEKTQLFVKQETQRALLLEALSKEAPVLQKRIILEEVKRIGGKSKDFTRIHGEDVQGLWEKQVGKQIMLPYGICAKRVYEGICIFRSGEEKKIHKDRKKSCPLPVSGTLKFGEYDITCQVIENNFKGIEEKKYTKWMDYDKMKCNLEFRYRCSGDKICVHGSGGNKKLKDYMIDSKIPREERDKVPLVACGNEILWIVGYRISEKYKVTENTKNIIRIQIKGGNIHE